MPLLRQVASKGFVVVSLAWPALVETGTFWYFYYEATPFFWMLDIILAIILAVTDENDWRARIRSYMSYAFLRDASVVLVDIFLMSGLVDEGLRLFTMLRLVRATKFRTVMSTFENRLAARGNMVLVYWSTILQAVLSILMVNHSLACAMFYIGGVGKQSGWPNWIETYDVVDQTGQRLASHPLYGMLMDARLSASGALVGAFRTMACVMGEPLFSRGERAEGDLALGLFVTVTGNFMLKTPQDEAETDVLQEK
eukprot:Skav210896  [mRNA]  locus=scaffold1060:143715:150338:- [translate_table: standard]